jgi:CheY-like chemotaxis protein/glycosyltransferase involved in cell wall biosynthesis
MKILAIDDQKLVLIPLEIRLKELGYEIITETSALKGIELFNSFQPDLVIVDINMPETSGIDVVKYIRQKRKSNIPIMILSGNTDENIISEAFDLGVNDYLKKPLSLRELCSRTKRLIGAPKIKNRKKTYDYVLIQKRCVGVVIPCYNEEKRLLNNKFTKFIIKNSGYHLCFVNDGSTDKTLEALNKLRKGREDFITVYDCKKNGGKAEAVRLGILHMAKQDDLDYIGFLDADLSTNLADFEDLVSTLEKSNFKIVSGSRICRIGAKIKSAGVRKIISITINFIIRKILKMEFKDTQCGAKIFRKDVIDIAFKEKFVTKWIFDVEIFKRIILHFGLKKAKKLICEKPLKRWVHVGGSKLSMKDSLKIVFQLFQIAWTYRKRSNNKIQQLHPPKVIINY